MLPGRYEVRLTVEGKTQRQMLNVAMDPRVTVSNADLAALLAFQREIEAEMVRSADLADARNGARKQLETARQGPAAARADAERALAELGRLTGTPEEDPVRVNSVLTSLARDLEGSDEPPTGPQRAVLQSAREALTRYEARWKALRLPR